MDNLKDTEATLQEEIILKRGRGRPRTRPIEEPKIKQKPGRKTNISSTKEYFNDYYHINYANNYINCPCCNKPIQKCKITRHMRGERCFTDQINKKYINNSIPQINQDDKEVNSLEFDAFCNYLIENPGAFKNPRLHKSII